MSAFRKSKGIRAAVAALAVAAALTVGYQASGSAHSSSPTQTEAWYGYCWYCWR
jgi:hypothetical protein